MYCSYTYTVDIMQQGHACCSSAAYQLNCPTFSLTAGAGECREFYKC